MAQKVSLYFSLCDQRKGNKRKDTNIKTIRTASEVVYCHYLLMVTLMLPACRQAGITALL